MVFEILRNEKKVLKEIEGGPERVEFLFLLIFIEDGAVIGKVDVLNTNFAGFFIHHMGFLFGSIGLDDKCGIRFCGVHFYLLAPVVLEAVEHLSLIKA